MAPKRTHTRAPAPTQRARPRRNSSLGVRWDEMKDVWRTDTAASDAKRRTRAKSELTPIPCRRSSTTRTTTTTTASTTMSTTRNKRTRPKPPSTKAPKPNAKSKSKLKPRPVSSTGKGNGCKGTGNENGNRTSTTGAKRKRTVHCYVPRYVLEGNRSAPFRRSRLRRFFRALRPHVTVLVERNPAGLSSSVLYAPELGLGRQREKQNQRHAFIPTSLVSTPCRAHERALVYSDSAYEIRVAGMCVKNYDSPFGDNELLMYSVHTDPSSTGDTNQSLPFIHYDYNRDATQNSDNPNVFIPIPASKSYVTSSAPVNGNSGKHHMLKKSVNVQFRILELDEPNDLVKSAVKGIDELGGYISSFTPAAPLMGVLSPALGLASAVSKRALDSYAAPDKVISIDMDFLLADRERVRQGTASPGEYLRYGYYFFLAEPVEGKLYASVRTPKNVQLMLRRCDKHTRRGKKYFPLTEVSYLVVRVTEPTSTQRMQRKPVQIGHAKQLENIFNQAAFHNGAADQNPDALRNAILSLGKSLGMIQSEIDGAVQSVLSSPIPSPVPAPARPTAAPSRPTPRPSAAVTKPTLTKPASVSPPSTPATALRSPVASTNGKHVKR